MTIANAAIAEPVELAEIRDLSRNELELLREGRETITRVQRFRDSHHRIARLLAVGLSNREVAERTGRSAAALSVLVADPAFQNLVANYRERVTEQFVDSVDEYYTLATSNMLAAERHIADHIDELDSRDELLPIRTALAISRDAADRFGYGKKQTNLNVNVDFAAKLEKMIARSGKTIEGTIVSSPPRGPTAPRAPEPYTTSQPEAQEPTNPQRLARRV